MGVSPFYHLKRSLVCVDVCLDLAKLYMYDFIFSLCFQESTMKILFLDPADAPFQTAATSTAWPLPFYFLFPFNCLADFDMISSLFIMAMREDVLFFFSRP